MSYEYNEDCESCRNQESLCIGCQVAMQDEHAEEWVEAEYQYKVKLLTKVNSPEDSGRDVVTEVFKELLGDNKEATKLIGKPNGFCTINLSLDEISLNFYADDPNAELEHLDITPTKKILGLDYGELVLRLHNIYRGLVNIGTKEFPIYPLDGCVALDTSNGEFTLQYLYIDHNGELVDFARDWNISCLFENHKTLTWLDEYFFDPDKVFYGCTSSFEDSVDRWYSYDYMLRIFLEGEPVDEA